MRLAPGPIPTITEDWYDKTVDAPAFGELVKQAYAELDGLEFDLDGLIDPALVLDDALPDDGLEPALDLAEVSVPQISADVGVLPVADIEAAKLMGDEALFNAYAVIPGEAFAPVPDPFNPPGVDSGPPVSNPLDVTIANVTRAGAADFAPGDRYRISGRIAPAQGGAGVYAHVAVTEYPWKDDVPQPKVELGETDQFGFMSFEGAFGSGDAGKWGATFYSTTDDGMQMAGPTLYWTVTPGPAGAPVLPAPVQPTPPKATPPLPVAPGVTVRLANISAPGKANDHFAVGDFWILTVKGAPNAPVQVGGFYNGDALAPVSLGSTNAQGVLTVQGQVSAAELGQWVEQYTVGGVPWNGTLQFLVTAQ